MPRSPRREPHAPERAVMHKAMLAILCLLLLRPGHAGTVTVPAARDSTLFESPDGTLASGAGAAVFAGRNNADQDSVRRGLLLFDLTKVFAEAGPQGVI